MTVESNWWFYPVSPDNVPTPTGLLYPSAFFMSDGTDSLVSGPTVLNQLYRKDATGACTPLIPTAYSDEAARDAVGAILTSTTSVTLTYADAGAGAGTITADVSTEYVQDIIGAFVTAGDGSIIATYNDAGNVETIVVGAITSASITGFAESVQDVVGAMLASSTSITVTYNDAGNTETFDVSVEFIQDTVGAFIAAGNGTITVTYNDAGNAETIQVGTITASLVSDFTEAVQDVVGAFVADSTTLDATYNDAGNAETIGVLVNSIDNTFLADVAEGTSKGRVFGAGTGDPTDMTRAQQEQNVNGGVAARASTAASVAIVAQTGEQVLGVAFTIPANSAALGDTWMIQATGLLVNAASVNKATARVRSGTVGSGVGAASVIGLAERATPAVARAAPGQVVQVIGFVTIKSTGAGGTIAGGCSLAGTTFDGGAFPVTPTTPPAAAVAFNTTIAQDVLLTIAQGVANAGTVLSCSITKM